MHQNLGHRFNIVGVSRTRDKLNKYFWIDIGWILVECFGWILVELFGWIFVEFFGWILVGFFGWILVGSEPRRHFFSPPTNDLWQLHPHPGDDREL